MAINHVVFIFGRIPVVLESHRSSQGRGGCAPHAPSPRSAPVATATQEVTCVASVSVGYCSVKKWSE